MSFVYVILFQLKIFFFSYSAHRGTTSASSSYWRTEQARTPCSRGPSPGPVSRPATAGGRFQSSSFSRYSSSTLCSDGNFSNGNNTPTDSVDTSAFSMRSSIHGVHTEPLYPPPMYPAPVYQKPLPHNRRPYLGGIPVLLFNYIAISHCTKHVVQD